MKYSDKLRDPRWQKKRLEILQRDNWTCQSCFAQENTLVVHHRVYHSNLEPWDYHDHALVTWCEDCHQAEHGERPSQVALLDRNLAQAGADWQQVSRIGLAIASDGPRLLSEYDWTVFANAIAEILQSFDHKGGEWEKWRGRLNAMFVARDESQRTP